MAEASHARRQPTLVGWISRDTLITLLLAAALWGLQSWHVNAPSPFSLVIAPTVGFIAAYVLCYIFHEWGHLLGARFSGGQMPLAPYAGALIGTFAIAEHTRRQFLWLSWGGVIAYVTVMLVALYIHFDGGLGLTGAGFAVGGLAFVSQSLAVDLPQIWRVSRGADIAATSAAGANAEVILRRTWQTWIPLAIGLLTWNLLF